MFFFSSRLSVKSGDGSREAGKKSQAKVAKEEELHLM